MTPLARPPAPLLNPFAVVGRAFLQEARQDLSELADCAYSVLAVDPQLAGVSLLQDAALLVLTSVLRVPGASVSAARPPAGLLYLAPFRGAGGGGGRVPSRAALQFVAALTSRAPGTQLGTSGVRAGLLRWVCSSVQAFSPGRGALRVLAALLQLPVEGAEETLVGGWCLPDEQLVSQEAEVQKVVTGKWYHTQ